MKRISGNDIFEILALSFSEAQQPNPVKRLHHELRFQDARAKIVFSLIQSWGVAAHLRDMMAGMMCDEHSSQTKLERIPPDQLAMRACEIVDAAWNELTHRGWIISQNSMDDESN